MDGLRFSQTRQSFYQDMSAAEDVDHDGVDEGIHSYDMMM